MQAVLRCLHYIYIYVDGVPKLESKDLLFSPKGEEMLNRQKASVELTGEPWNVDRCERISL